jgi:hypothetical protein
MQRSKYSYTSPLLFSPLLRAFVSLCPRALSLTSRQMFFLLLITKPNNYYMPPWPQPQRSHFYRICASCLLSSLLLIAGSVFSPTKFLLQKKNEV